MVNSNLFHYVCLYFITNVLSILSFQKIIIPHVGNKLGGAYLRNSGLCKNFEMPKKMIIKVRWCLEDIKGLTKRTSWVATFPILAQMAHSYIVHKQRCYETSSLVLVSSNSVTEKGRRHGNPI